MDKEDLIVELESRFGLTENNLTIVFQGQKDQIRITYDLKGYAMKRPLNLDPFWEKLQDLPSTQTQHLNAESMEAQVIRKELEDLLSKLDPPIQA